MARSYGGFCPVAKAAEVLAERWTPLIVRELLAGSRRYEEIRTGVPGIPRSLLTARLRALERAGVVERRVDGRPPRPRVAYNLTAAGHDLNGVVMALGEWGQRWVNHTIAPDDVDPRLLAWDMHRRVRLDRLPNRRVVVQIDFKGALAQTIWLVLERPEPSVCLHDAGYTVDLLLAADTVALHQVWMGRLTWAAALRSGLVDLVGPRTLARAFPSWLMLNVFAPVPPAATRRLAG